MYFWRNASVLCQSLLLLPGTPGLENTRRWYRNGFELGKHCKVHLSGRQEIWGKWAYMYVHCYVMGDWCSSHGGHQFHIKGWDPLPCLGNTTFRVAFQFQEPAITIHTERVGPFPWISSKICCAGLQNRFIVRTTPKMSGFSIILFLDQPQNSRSSQGVLTHDGAPTLLLCGQLDSFCGCWLRSWHQTRVSSEE